MSITLFQEKAGISSGPQTLINSFHHTNGTTLAYYKNVQHRLFGIITVS